MYQSLSFSLDLTPFHLLTRNTNTAPIHDNWWSILSIILFGNSLTDSKHNSFSRLFFLFQFLLFFRFFLFLLASFVLFSDTKSSNHVPFKRIYMNILATISIYLAISLFIIRFLIFVCLCEAQHSISHEHILIHMYSLDLNKNRPTHYQKEI